MITCNKTQIKNKQKGFTLIELTLYIGIVGFIIFAVTVLFSVLVQARVTNQTALEVEKQGLEALHIVKYELRHAESINTPANSGDTSSILDIDSIIDGRNVVFSVSAEGSLQMEVDGGNPILLTNTRVEVSAIEFQSVSASSRYEGARFEFTLEHINPADKKEYDYQRTFMGGASLRPHDR